MNYDDEVEWEHFENRGDNNNSYDRSPSHKGIGFLHSCPGPIWPPGGGQIWPPGGGQIWPPGFIWPPIIRPPFRPPPIIFRPPPMIPSVQEMVRRDPCHVPKEYIRAQSNNVGLLHHLTPQIPVIDLSELKKGCKKELSKLDMACKEWGFFQLVNHGVQEQILKGIKDATADFLKLPLNEKQKYAMPMENKEGYGHLQGSNDEQKRDWSDSLMLVTHPTQNRDLSFWPKTPVKYKELTDIFSSKLYEVGVELLNCVSMNLGVKKDTLVKLHEGPRVYFDMNYYPPCNKSDRVLAMSSHCDDNSITMVMQDQDVTALQIKHKGYWVPMTPLPKAIICNIGGLIETWSNGIYKSVEHRVVTNKTKVRSVHEVFLIPPPNVVVKPIHVPINRMTRVMEMDKTKVSSLFGMPNTSTHGVTSASQEVFEGRPKLYQEIRVGDYAHVYTNTGKQGRSQIESMMMK